MADLAHITRGLESLSAGEQRNRIWEFLIEDSHEDGARERYGDLNTIGDLKRAGSKALTARGMQEDDAAWLLKQIGGATRGRKPKVKNG